MASSKPRRAFDELPFEMVEAVTAFLELQDIRNLRLVSQTIAVKSGRRTFKKYFANKTINWKSRTELRSLVQMTQPQRMGCFLKSLTIKSHAPTASREYSKEIALLTEALTNLRHNSVYGGLESVILTFKGQSVVRKGGRAFLKLFLTGAHSGRLHVKHWRLPLRLSQRAMSLFRNWIYLVVSSVAVVPVKKLRYF